MLGLFFSACGLDEADQESMLIFSQDYDFDEGRHEWVHGFADYPGGQNDSTLYELRYAYTNQPVDVTKKSVMLSGRNLNQDLFMYLKRKIGRLSPDTEYTITFNVELVSNHYSNSSDSGPVYLKAGATPTEPKTITESGYNRINIDKGNQSMPGVDMISLGDLRTSESNSSYVLITRNNIVANSPYVVRTNSNGELWLIVGTESDMGGTNTVYYTRVNVVFSAS